MKECMDYEVECVRPRGRPKKSQSEVTEKDCDTRQMCKLQDAMKLIMVALCNRADHYIFALWFLSFFFFISFSFFLA